MLEETTTRPGAAGETANITVRPHDTNISEAPPSSQTQYSQPDCASLIRREAERLESVDEDAFVRVAYELYERALVIQDTRLGASHPLMSVVNRIRGRTSIDRLDEGIEDYRRSLVESNTE